MRAIWSRLTLTLTLTLTVFGLGLGLGRDAAEAQPAETADDDEVNQGGFLGQRARRLAIDDCPTPSTLDPAALRKLAAEHYDRGEVLYVQGDYRGAVSEFIASYCLLPYYTVLKDIGQAYERNLEYEEAVAYLERYVLAVPDDAKRGSPCEPLPAKDKRNVSARISVLRNLEASLQVATNPSNAEVTLTSAAGVRAVGRANGSSLNVVAGRYTMTIALPGYQTIEREVEPAIGKPYSYYFELEPKKGRVHISVVPADARIFIDDRLVGIGAFDSELAGGSYNLVIEGGGRTTVKRKLDVVADREVRMPVFLPRVPTDGRGQLVAAAGAAGATTGAIGIRVAFESDIGTAAGAGIGLGVGLLGGWLGVSTDIPEGSSSFIITAALAGAVEGAAISELFTDDDEVTATSGLVGMVSAATLATLTHDKLRLSAGDAALLNSGALWGASAGAIFAGAFDFDEGVENVLLLSGLNVGLASSALLGRKLEWSRGHVALIDLAGLGGTAIGVAVESAYQSEVDTNATGGVRERTAHFALAGMTVGLIAGAYLTRNMDQPKIRIRPTLNKGGDHGDVLMFGVAGEL